MWMEKGRKVIKKRKTIYVLAQERVKKNRGRDSEWDAKNVKNEVSKMAFKTLFFGLKNFKSGIARPITR